MIFGYYMASGLILDSVGGSLCHAWGGRYTKNIGPRKRDRGSSGITGNVRR